MIFKNIKKYTESKRGSRNIFFVWIIKFKDFLWWKIYVGFFSRLLLRFYSKFIFKDKFGIVFVICKYKENIDWLKNLPYKHVVYSRVGNDEVINNHKTLKLKNVGKDAFSILTFIIDNYDSLPNYVGFLQGEPFDHSPLLALMINRFNGEGYYPLSPNMRYRSDVEVEAEFLKVVENSTSKYLGIKKDIFEFPFGTQFIVSKEKILKHNIEEYKFLRDRLEEFEDIDSGCTNVLHPKKPCPCLHNISVWMLEVWWPIFFGEDKNLITFD